MHGLSLEFLAEQAKRFPSTFTDSFFGGMAANSWTGGVYAAILVAFLCLLPECVLEDKDAKKEAEAYDDAEDDNDIAVMIC